MGCLDVELEVCFSVITGELLPLPQAATTALAEVQAAPPLGSICPQLCWGRLAFYPTSCGCVASGLQAFFRKPCLWRFTSRAGVDRSMDDAGSVRGGRADEVDD